MKRLGILALVFMAQGAMAAGVSIENVWIRATVPDQQVAGAYMEITSPVNARLVGAQSPAAGSMEIHFMRMNHGVMEMREIKALPLPKGKTVTLAPGGFHLMLFDLKQPFKAVRQCLSSSPSKQRTKSVKAWTSPPRCVT